MSFYNCKKVLVTGGTGLIGRPLLDLLLEAKANITCVSLDSPNDIDDKINFILLKNIGKTDLPNKNKISINYLKKFAKTISQY